MFLKICNRARRYCVLQSNDGTGHKEPPQSCSELFFLVLCRLSGVRLLQKCHIFFFQARDLFLIRLKVDLSFEKKTVCESLPKSQMQVCSVIYVDFLFDNLESRFLRKRRVLLSFSSITSFPLFTKISRIEFSNQNLILTQIATKYPNSHSYPNSQRLFELKKM